MCGIFGVVHDVSNNAARTVLGGLKKLEYRGYDSWGIALVPEGGKKIEVDKHIGKIGEAETTLGAGSLAIGHTRWATHGGVTDRNAHPHLDCSKTIAVIHNGIVENYQEFKTKLVSAGHRFISETDTEIIAHLIEEKRAQKNLRAAVFEVFSMLSGSNAIAVLDLTDRTIIACRNGSPLVIGIGKNQTFLASDVTAFLRSTRNVHFLVDGEAVEITDSHVDLFDTVTGKRKKLSPQKIDWKVEDAEKAGFPHFLLKEITEQQTTIPKVTTINESVLTNLAKKMREGYKTVLIGCGTASYCALAAKYFFARVGLSAEAYGAYEYLPFANYADPKTVVIAISQSGETADTLIASRYAQKKGALLVALVNARGSTLERMADYVIPVGAGPEIAVVSTKAFTSQLSTLYLLSHTVNGTGNEAKRSIVLLGRQLKEWLGTKRTTAALIDLAKMLVDQEHAYLVGKHLNYPAALEFALKLKESAYLHAEAFAAGELKHGVIALIQKDTPCFVLGSSDEVKNEVLSSAAELKARGAYIIGVAPFKAREFDAHIMTPEAGELTIFGNIIAGQLLGYYLGVGRGADPDKPRNLAKSVTVK